MRALAMVQSHACSHTVDECGVLIIIGKVFFQIARRHSTKGAHPNIFALIILQKVPYLFRALRRRDMHRHVIAFHTPSSKQNIEV